MRVFSTIVRLIEAVATGIGVVLGLVPDPGPAPRRIHR